MGLLEVHQLNKNFGDHKVLNDVSFTVQDGEFFVLLGPSGGGKSTILKILCGIEKADAGRVVLAGRDITNLPPRDRNTGMVFQDYGLYPHMNVFENIAYGLEARNYPREEIGKRVREAAERLGLTPLIERVIVDLSGGEQQRVALARALAKDAEMYLFDEPISNLDPKLRAHARRDIQMVHRAKKKPTLYVTHDQNEALAIADRIAIIAHGQLQQVGTAEELLNRPANLFVAGFLGAPAMNLFTGTLEAEPEGGFAVRLAPDFLLTLPPSWDAALLAYGGQQIVAGIPPTAFVPVAAEPVGADAAHDRLHPQVSAVLDSFEPLVSEVILSITLPGGLSGAATLQEIDEDSLLAGQSIRLGILSEQVRLFDPGSGLAL